ncbi:hypothetical protein BH09VER1_BH09VER1_03030 [soil metagenome]
MTTVFNGIAALTRVAIPFLLLAASALADSKAPQAYSITPEPAWVEPPAPTLDAKIPEDQVSDGLYNILSDTEIRAATHETYLQMVRKVLSDTGVQNGSEIQIEVDPAYEKLQLHKVEVYRAGAWHDHLDQKLINVLQQEREMDQFMIDGRSTIVVRLSDIRPGDIIRYSYTLSGGNPALEGHFATSFNTLSSDPCAHLRERIWMPAGQPLYSKSHQTLLNPTVTKSDHGDLYEWNIINAPAMLAETEVPYWEDLYPWVDASDMSSWADAVQWALPLYNFSLPLPPDLETRVAAIKQEKDPEQQVLAALRLVQDDVSYFGNETGEHSHKPRTPTEVYDQRFGDCKEKVLLLGTILHRLGIESHAVLVNSSWGRGLREMVPSIAAFDHVVLQITLRGHSQIVDTTREYQRGPLSSLSIDDFGWGLVVREGNTDLTRLNLPPNSAPRDEVVQSFEIPDVDNSAPGYLEVHTTYRGDSAETQRESFATLSRVELQEKARQSYAELYPAIEIAQPLRVQDNEKENVVETWEEYRIPHIWSHVAGSKLVAVTFYPTQITSFLKKPATSGRLHPYDLDYPINLSVETKIKFPRKVEVDPVRFDEKNVFFDLNYRTAELGKTITISCTYQALADSVPANQLAVYRAAVDRAMESLGYEMSSPARGEQ